MKLAVIHGSPRRGNTYSLTQQFLDEMKKRGDTEVKEFFLPQDVPEFCRGCTACVLRGEEHCPHAHYIQPILSAMLEADALVFATPVYVMSCSGGMKNFLDHLPFLFVVHRPRTELFGKPVIILSTAAGAGMRPAMKTIARTVKYWGVGSVRSLGFAVMAEDWNAIPAKRKEKIGRKVTKAAASFRHRAESGKKSPTLFFRMMFRICRTMERSGKWNPTDTAYWKEHGWI